MDGQDERIIRYRADGSIELSDGARTQAIPPGWSDAEIDAAAAAFFGPGGGAG